MESKHISVLVVPTGLQQIFFSHYHASPSSGHRVEYKTLYRLRSRFFCPKMREDIKQSVAKCAHCVAAYDIWSNRKSELYFSWPIASPLWIIYTYFWSPGNAAPDSRVNTGYLMNSLCDLTQFVVSTPTFNITAASLEKYS